MFLGKVGTFLIKRCEELGYIPLITKTPPPNKLFPVEPSPDAIYIKLFGHFNSTINTIHARFGVLDPKNLTTLGYFDDRNLSLTEMDKLLLFSTILPTSVSSLQDHSKNSQTLQDLYNIWLSDSK